ncbi:unnamed protein product, partial [Iphiclides podalirius]
MFREFGVLWHRAVWNVQALVSSCVPGKLCRIALRAVLRRGVTSRLRSGVQARGRERGLFIPGKRKNWDPSGFSDVSIIMGEASLETFCWYTNRRWVEELLTAHGHEVLRLPPYHCDLNPVEKIWSLVKRKVADKNVEQDPKEIVKSTVEAFESITAEDWTAQCTHVEHLEEEYLKMTALWMKRWTE